jgi:hypothetical protein
MTVDPQARAWSVEEVEAVGAFAEVAADHQD